jgi:hypothetical protein
VDRGYWRGQLKTKDHLEDKGIDGRITLQLIIKKQDGRGCKLDSFGSGQGDCGLL